MSKEKLRLLSLSTSFPNSVNPGSGVFVHRLLHNLPNDISTVVVTPDTNRVSVRQQLTERLDIKPFRYAPKKYQVLAHQPGGLPAASQRRWRFLFLLPAMEISAFSAVWIGSRKADVLHGQWAPSGLVAGIVGKLAGKPVVTTLWGTDVLWGQRSFLFRCLLGVCVRLSDRVVAVSRAMRDQVVHWFPGSRKKVMVIENGVDVVSGRSEDGDTGEFRIGVIGNLIPLKGVDQVVRAVKELTHRHPSVRLLIVGDGPEKEKLQQLARDLRLENHVSFIGRVLPDEVPGYLKTCKALVLASRSEGRPNIVLEAMASGVPVVASDIAPVKELVTHGLNGLLFPVGQWRSIVEQLAVLIEDTGLGSRLSRNAGKWLEDRQLTWRHTAAQYAALYRHLSTECSGPKR